MDFSYDRLGCVRSMPVGPLQSLRASSSSFGELGLCKVLWNNYDSLVCTVQPGMMPISDSSSSGANGTAVLHLSALNDDGEAVEVANDL